jgi:aminopeptidase N
MITEFLCRAAGARLKPAAFMVVAVTLAILSAPLRFRADEPYARSRDYDLEHSKMAFRFDIEQRRVLGDVTHSISILRDNLTKVVFDSVGLTIESVTINKAPAKFESAAEKLAVVLPNAARAGDKYEIAIRYQGQPAKGMYFILPDKDYPDRPKQIWTQGESEDTRYYLPTYDYPNDRLTTETILTVPASWVTVGNGKLVSVVNASGGMKTWTWRESLPSSTYLITVVAGEFDEVKQSWRGVPVTYYAPKGRGERLLPNYERTPEMMELFSRKLGVAYPWEKYAQVMVDDFVAGGMENASATTNNSGSLKNPKLIGEFPGDEDPLISHELGHQWFGDLVTCKDWGNIWLNEGFATFLEMVWSEEHYPKDQADYERWVRMKEWSEQANLYGKPLVRHDFDDSSEFDGNSYGKAGLVLYMLRHQIGEEVFYRGLKRYLEVNRGKNVVTADLIKAVEEASHIDVQRFFDQWVYGAGAPKFDVGYTYDDAKHQIALTVKQTQRLEGRVGVFDVPIDVEIATTSGSKAHTIHISKEAESFVLPAETVPLMVVFDKGGRFIKFVDFHKEKKEWLYQLRNATEVADRADAIAALAKIKNDDEVLAALGSALNTDKAWGVRDMAADALGHFANAGAAKQLLDALDSNGQPFVRNHIVAALGEIKDQPKIITRLQTIAREDTSYRARANALQSLARLKAPDALSTLTAAVQAESPDDILRNAALRSLGFLGDDKGVAVVRQWAAPGRDIETREVAIASLARLDKSNKEVTAEIAKCLMESHYPIRYAAIYSLGSRGDASAVPALEALLKRDDLSIDMAPTIKEQIARLQKQKGEKGSPHEAADSEDEKEEAEQAIIQRLEKLEHLIQEMSERLKLMEARLPKN